jgi:hypothetical protein
LSNQDGVFLEKYVSIAGKPIQEAKMMRISAVSLNIRQAVLRLEGRER